MPLAARKHRVEHCVSGGDLLRDAESLYDDQADESLGPALEVGTLGQILAKVIGQAVEGGHGAIEVDAMELARRRQQERVELGRSARGLRSNGGSACISAGAASTS